MAHTAQQIEAAIGKVEALADRDPATDYLLILSRLDAELRRATRARHTAHTTNNRSREHGNAPSAYH